MDSASGKFYGFNEIRYLAESLQDSAESIINSQGRLKKYVHFICKECKDQKWLGMKHHISMKIIQRKSRKKIIVCIVDIK